MDSLLTPGMSTMLDFADETFEYPALEYATTPGAKDIYGDGFAFSQKDWDAGNKFLSAFDSPGISSTNQDGVVEPAGASAQTPELTSGPSAATNSSSSTSQASPSVAPDYFSRPRQPNSDGNSAHFVTAKPIESNNYSEFRKAINNRFNRARAAISAPPSNFSNDDGNQQAPFTNISDSLMDFSFTDFEAQQQSGQFQASDLDTVAEAEGPAPRSQFDQQDRPHLQSSSHYAELDPELAGGEGPGSANTQTACIPPPASQGPAVSGDTHPPPPIKRRRRRKAPPSAEVKAQKHKAFLERNREAASKCRTKKKTQIQQLEEDERDGRVINQLLKDEFRDVLGEVLLLREQVKLQDLACGGNCGGKCGGVAAAEDEEKQEDAAIMMEDEIMEGGGVERDADVVSAVHNRDGNLDNVESCGAPQVTSGAGRDSDSDGGEEEASDDEDADLDEDQNIIKNERVTRPPR